MTRQQARHVKKWRILHDLLAEFTQYFVDTIDSVDDAEEFVTLRKALKVVDKNILAIDPYEESV
jgi:hypothetical protein